jgi:acyl-CoA reductase-like NAD-dependent aldehyde dehydrogenase
VTQEAEKERKRRLKRAFQEAERRRQMKWSPLSPSELHELLDAVSRLMFDEQGRAICDRTHSLTRLSLQIRGKTNTDEVISFLRSRGSTAPVWLH